MRVAILAPHAGYIVGGVETTAKWLKKHLSGKHECEVFSLWETTWTRKIPGKKSTSSPSLVKKLRLHHLNHLIPYVYIIKNNAFSEFSYSFNLFPILKSFEPDIIINLNNSIIALFCKYFRRRCGVPFLHVAQAGGTYLELKSAFTMPDAFVALTPAAQEYIEKRVPHLQVVVIPNGVDINLFSPQGPKTSVSRLKELSENAGLKLDRPFILSTSRLVREKRLDLLIKAVSQLDKGTLILVGRGEARQRLINLGRKILKNRIILIDTLSQEELSKLYRSGDVFSLPSRNEAFGNVIIEAMASGLPVVATNDKGFEWMLGARGGILVDVTDTPAYARALKRAYEEDFGDGPEKQARNFSWQRVTRQYEELMESIRLHYT